MASQRPPERGPHHDALEIFLGEWRAEGQSFGGSGQNPHEPRAHAILWTSTHSARWHTGKFFLIQDERAQVAGPFDTLSVMGWDEEAGRYFANTFENHGFSRRYDVTVDGKVWTLSGETERARIAFSADGKLQTIVWEWKPKGEWLPLCDRVAEKR